MYEIKKGSVGRGGKRKGAGRKSAYGSPTKAIRVPLHLVDDVKNFVQEGKKQFPLYGSKVAAGFPSPADDFMDTQLDLNEYLIKNTAATFFVRVSGDSMLGAGIHDGDLLIVDRSLEPQIGKIVIAAVNSELTVKRYTQKDGQVYLSPENDNYQPIPINAEDGIHVWGVVTNVIHPV
ncbi:MAG: translesion error-prone DNA polymerase V autoproteolytic subunit [Pseudomonadota bacterium]|nr:translesion error-prone DNA polymerase V autoproteolytic subunit [Pseudomonadota bacterium]|tara:strand:- start:1236 stop:1766 length:531 start_codon:yes stop_codon:yes gene_type:complete